MIAIRLMRFIGLLVSFIVAGGLPLSALQWNGTDLPPENKVELEAEWIFSLNVAVSELEHLKIPKNCYFLRAHVEGDSLVVNFEPSRIITTARNAFGETETILQIGLQGCEIAPKLTINKSGKILLKEYDKP